MTPLDRVRASRLALAEKKETLSQGAPTFWVKKKTFANFNDKDHYHDVRVALWLAAPPGLQETLAEVDPEVYFRPNYVGVRGWIGVYLDRELRWEEVASLI